MATTYTIKSGDTLSKIAAAYGTTVAALASANGISNPNLIKAGASISIPTASSSGANSQNSGALTPSIGPGSIPAATASSRPATSILGDGEIGPLAPKAAAPASAPAAPVTTYAAPAATGGATGSSPASGSSGANLIPGTNYPSTGNADLDGIITSTVGTGGVLSKQLASGSVIDPALDITPALVSQFLSEAHTQVDPEYQQAFANEIDSVNSSLANLGTQYQNDQDTAQANFQQNLNTERNAAGGSGIAFSGERGLAENYLVNGENRTLSSLGATYANNVGNTERAGAAAVGGNTFGLSSGTAGFTVPTVGSQTATLDGARGGVGVGTTPTFDYDPSTYSGYGTISAGYGADLTANANENLQNYQSAAAAAPSRSFTDLNGTPTLQ